MSDIEIEIDGQVLSAAPNAMVIEVADAAGIYIPRFCYHKHLAIAANCRMCLVEVEKAPKTLPACATPVMPGMKVFTKSPKALASQKAVMEFLLVNHPLDCPICDQGGECELQDLSMGYGSAESYYSEGKRSVQDKDIGPLIATDMTRCIQCTRCVRFGAEIAGMRELGATGRGENLEIGTYIDHAMKSEVSGNVIDLCPVGALTSKPYRFTARAWELNQFPTVSPHDCIGANLNAHTRNGQVMRIVPRENDAINQTWISDRDRYSYAGLDHADRLKQPRIKLQGVWQEVDWQTALDFCVKKLGEVITAYGAENIGALISPSSTIEEFYLLQKLLRQLGSSNIDHRLRQSDFDDQDAYPIFPKLDITLTELEKCDRILLVGSNIQKDQPSAGLRVRKAFRTGAKIFLVNVRDYDFYFDSTFKKIVSPAEIENSLAKIAKALLITQEISADLIAYFDDIEIDDTDIAFADAFKTGENRVIILGNLAQQLPNASQLRKLVGLISEWSGAKVGVFTEGGNSAGAWIAGAIPHRGPVLSSIEKPGFDTQTMLQKALPAYLLVNVEPELDLANPTLAMKALSHAQFVLSMSVFSNRFLDEQADVILPIAAFTETSGTYLNVTGEWQSVKGVANAFEQSRPAWKVLRVLGNLFHLKDFDYATSKEISDEVKSAFERIQPHLHDPRDASSVTLSRAKLSEISEKLIRISEVPLYATDPLVRRSEPLQKAQTILEGDLTAVRMHPTTALLLNLADKDMVRVTQNNCAVQLKLALDMSLPLNSLAIPAASPVSAALGEPFGPIDIVRI